MNLLDSVFTVESSNMYNNSSRVFGKEYEVNVEGINSKCKLTTQWGNSYEDNSRNRNSLCELIKLAKENYPDEINKDERAKDIVESYIEKFLLDELPSVFDSSFSRRYITSLLAKPFVILAGNSGTGKTRISKQFAENLEVDDENGEKNWLIVPVGADWTDNTKIMGFYNPLTDNGIGKYEKTGIVKIIERADANPDIPYFLILDEMNLSRVERYFSDFLSHMETPDNPFELDGYGESNDKSEKSGKLPYLDNLFVIGTVNIDETTYMFSPKVLDRANVIEFKPEKDDVLGMFCTGNHGDEVMHAKPGVAKDFFRISKEIRNGSTKVDDEQMEDVRDLFSSVYDAMENGNGYEFAYRTVKEIKQYISAARELSDQWDDDQLYRAADEQLLQKILPKVHGNGKEIGKMLDGILDVCSQKKLELSRKKIEKMKGKLDVLHYASFT